MKTGIRTISIFAILLIASLNVHSQILPTSPKNNVQIEAMGHGLLYSLNYERSLFELENLRSTIRVGISKYSPNHFMPLWVPISLNTQIRIENNHWLEIGYGKVLNDEGIRYPDRNFKSNLTFDTWIFRLGYHYDFGDGKYLLKIAYTPFLENEYGIRSPGPATEQLTSNLRHWGGVSFGCRF